MNGCVAYYPQVVDIPLIKEKGDLRINVGGFFAPGSHETGDAGAHGTISAGLTNMLAIQAYGSFDIMARIHLQGAVGVFKGFENKTVIEWYGGYGYGNGFWTALAGPKNDYHLAFTQFNIGKSGLGAAHIDYGLGVKGGYLNGNYVDYSMPAESRTVDRKNGWMIEPSVFFRFGSRKVKFCTMVSYMWTQSTVAGYYFPVNIGMGVNFTLGNRSK